MDRQLLLLINREWTSPALDRFMALLSCFDAWLWPLLLLLVVLLVRGGFKARAWVLTAALIVGVGDGVISKNLKRLVDRPRPFQLFGDVVRQVDLAKARPRFLALGKPVKVKFAPSTFSAGEGRSFPSAHTMNMTAVALVTAVFYRRRGWLAFIPALLVGYSRIYVGAHFPSDIATSICLSLGVSLLLLCALEWLWQRIGGDLLPGVHLRNPKLFAA